MKPTPRVEGNQLLTDQWELRIHGEFVLRKDYQPKLVDCTHCKGYGKFSTGHFGTGEKEDCDWCCGTGKRTDTSHITEERPEMPIELINHMRNAFTQYLTSKALIDKEDELNPVTYI